VADPAEDCDDDGVPNGVDCAPADPGSHTLPSDSVRLDVTKPSGSGGTDALVAWTGLAAAAGSATVHDIVTGRLSELAADRGFDRATCLLADEPGTTASDPRLTGASSDGYWYLVRGDNACGVGSYGAGSPGPARAVPPVLCQ